MTVQIPLETIPNQQFSVVLDDQNCVIRLFQKGDNLYLDLDSNKVPIIRGAFCGVNMDIVVNSSPDFTGMLYFADLSNVDHDPHYSEFGTRYILLYTPESEL